jgi:threonine/homoserine/homoserine lactone efflux protein
MSSPLFIAFLTFGVAAAFTPGPNNVMLLASGVNFGFVRTLPHIMGVGIGFSVMVMLIGVGLGAVFVLYPVLHTLLKYAGAAYLLYLAWAIARSGGAGGIDAGGAGRPMSFFGSAAFQWVNVKGWIIALGAVTTYAGIAEYPANIIVLGLVFFVLGLASAATWTAFGSSLRHVLESPRALRLFNVTMGLLLAGSLVPVLWEG